MARRPVVEVEHLSVGYMTPRGLATAVDDVSFTIYENEIVGVVGESGCGKSTLANAVMRLLGPGAYVTGGRIRVDGQDVYRMQPEALRQFRWTTMSMVFQSAMNVLNPVKTVASHFEDTFLAHVPNMSKREIADRAAELLRLVRIDPSRLRSYPHELSGGMRQRVVIAIAIALSPRFVIMDEPTTALDVVVQRSILESIMELQGQIGFSVLFISHDINLVTAISNRVGVMYAGRLVELSEAAFDASGGFHHPYTQGLLRAIPKLAVGEDEIEGIPGSPPSPFDMPSGCSFHPRCPYRKPECSMRKPPLVVAENYQVECHLTPAERRGELHVH
ncbi:MAG: ABC transporter ATP-binding protein [Alicyclobacillus sp.]|nr:ABC transporter ATP-binding protein [Alicyclobacillus sp.]